MLSLAVLGEISAQENETEIALVASTSEDISDTTATTANKGIEIGKFASSFT